MTAWPFATNAFTGRNGERHFIAVDAVLLDKDDPAFMGKQGMNEVDRRSLLALGGAAVAAGALPAALDALTARRAASAVGGVLLFDAVAAEARTLAGQARGQRLIAVSGDPVRLWRDRIAGRAGPVSGITRWSDYLVLRSLAEEHGLRVRREDRVPVARGASLVRWSMG